MPAAMPMAGNSGMKLIDRWCDNAWIWFIITLSMAALAYPAANWRMLPLGAKGGLMAGVIMPLHVLEEWKMPGGLHCVYNVWVFGRFANDTHSLDRFPMSRLTDMNTNVGLVIFPFLYAALSVAMGLSAPVVLCMTCFGFLEFEVLEALLVLRGQGAFRAACLCDGSLGFDASSGREGSEGCES